MAVCPRAGEADDDAPGAAELALERLNALRRRLKILREEAFENFHGGLQGLAYVASTTIATQGNGCKVGGFTIGPIPSGDPYPRRQSG